MYAFHLFRWFCFLLPSTVLAFVFSLAFSVQGAERLTLGTYYSAPYQTKSEDGSLTGSSVKVINCISEKLNKQTQYLVNPWKRAQNKLRFGEIDGIFTVALSSKPFHGGVYSAPISMEKWYWYYLSSFKWTSSNALRIGAVRGSSISRWLEDSGVSLSKEASTQEQLLGLLERERLDLIVADAREFEKGDIAVGSNLESSFIRFSPMGVLFSEDLQLSEPGIIEEFNSQIHACSPPELELSLREQDMLIEYLRRGYGSHAEKLSQLLVDNTQITTAQEKREFDLLETPLSIALRQLKDESRGILTEVFIVSLGGYTLGTSDRLSDHWHGDEDKVSFHFSNSASNASFVSSVRFDHSTQLYQSQVSFKVIPAGGKEPLGFIVFGIDVAKLIAADYVVDKSPVPFSEILNGN